MKTKKELDKQNKPIVEMLRQARRDSILVISDVPYGAIVFLDLLARRIIKQSGIESCPLRDAVVYFADHGIYKAFEGRKVFQEADKRQISTNEYIVKVIDDVIGDLDSQETPLLKAREHTTALAEIGTQFKCMEDVTKAFIDLLCRMDRQPAGIVNNIDVRMVVTTAQSLWRAGVDTGATFSQINQFSLLVIAAKLFRHYEYYERSVVDNLRLVTDDEIRLFLNVPTIRAALPRSSIESGLFGPNTKQAFAELLLHERQHLRGKTFISLFLQ